MTTSVLLGLVSALLFGVRHGIDYDHIAAITDITSTGANKRESMRLGMLYAAGHGLVVLVLGFLAVMIGASLPPAIDLWMERCVGVTLIALGAYVAWTLVAVPREHFRITSRFSLLSKALGRVMRKPHLQTALAGRSSFTVGMIHGIGAETPTQLAVFLFAAGVGGKVVGMLGVLLFVTGVLIMNALMCAASIGLFGLTHRKEAIYRGLAGLSAIYSMSVGVLFLLGAGELLPSLP